MTFRKTVNRKKNKKKQNKTSDRVQEFSSMVELLAANARSWVLSPAWGEWGRVGGGERNESTSLRSTNVWSTKVSIKPMKQIGLPQHSNSI